MAIMSQEGTDLIDQEIREMLSQGPISVVKNLEGQFLSSLPLVGKKDGGKGPVINLKVLNKVVPDAYFKMKGLFFFKEMLLPGNFM